MAPRREGPVIGTPVIRLEETSSTIDQARRLARQGAAHGTVVVADRQAAGRGRRGRAWYTVPGKSLAATLILREMPGPEHLPLAGMTAALAVVAAVERLFAVQLRTKWPNDVVCDRKKLAGTLAELTGDAVLLSIGLNINGTEADLPPDTRAVATTLQTILGRPADRDEVTERVFAELSALWDLLMCQPAELIRRWQRLDTATGARVRVAEADGGCTEGKALGVDATGRLRIETPDGAVRPVSAADVTIV